MKSRTMMLFLLVLCFLSIGCSNVSEENMIKYKKCTSSCASVIATEDYTTIHLCNEECKEKFLNETG